MREIQPALMTREEAAKYLGMSMATLATWVSKNPGRLPYVKMGRLAKYRKEDLDNFIEKNTIR